MPRKIFFISVWNFFFTRYFLARIVFPLNQSAEYFLLMFHTCTPTLPTVKSQMVSPLLIIIRGYTTPVHQWGGIFLTEPETLLLKIRAQNYKRRKFRDNATNKAEAVICLEDLVQGIGGFSIDSFAYTVYKPDFQIKLFWGFSFDTPHTLQTSPPNVEI